MHPRITELLEYLDLQRAQLREAIDSVSPEHRETAPAAERWSVANVLEHLGLLETRLTGLIRMKIAEARGAGIGMETRTDSVLASIDMARLLDRERRLIAPSTVQPTSNLNAVAAWDALEQARADLRAVIIDADGLALGEITYTHAAFGAMDLYQWIAFVGGHEARHTAQIREIGRQVALPAGGSL